MPVELFHEIYGCYYAVVGKILRTARQNGVTRADIHSLVDAYAFAESGLHLIPRLLDGTWDLLREEDGRWYSKLAHARTETPLTNLQKSWLKTILQDPRMRLFLSDEQTAQYGAWLADIPRLWQTSDFHVFDRALDGDPYEDTEYRGRFALLLRAIHERAVLLADYQKGKGGTMRISFVPTHFQYSAKDDKFRVLGRELLSNGRVKPLLINVARIITLERSGQPAPQWMREKAVPPRPPHTSQVLLYIWPERNGLERCMTQFAFYEKETWTDERGPGHYCRIQYPRDEETELLIRILSFGPVVRVLEPEPFVRQVRRRVEKQGQWLPT